MGTAARTLPAARPTIVFSHANGFPAGTYRVLFDQWREAGWRVEAIERIGHDPKYPVTSNWPHVRDQLIDFIRAVGGAPVCLVGHSLGGFLSLMVACRRPDLVRQVVLMDSPVIAGWRAHSLQVAKATGLMRRVSPGKVSQRRRHAWPSAEAALQHFAGKAVFARWDPRVLRDYVSSGTEPVEGGEGSEGGGSGVSGVSGVQLAFRREIETTIYNTLPHHVGRIVRKHPPQCPVAFIGGTQSVEVRQVGLAATRAVTRGRIEWIEGSHLFPMEHPDETAAAALRLLQETA